VSTKVEVATLPECDICTSEGLPGVVAYVDGRMRRGSWAYMCKAHWKAYGVGQLGTGSGQELVLRGAAVGLSDSDN
jgi:hypothetical protein